MADSQTTFSKKILFFLVYLLGLFGAIIALDRLVIAHFADKQYDDGMVLPPFTRIQIKTIEYSYQVYVNNFGFRDSESNAEKSPQYRILAIGDSFTYGWGVEIGQTWPKVLEKILNDQGRKIEVDDLGKPGAGPRDYADIAEKAIPVLKPDLVIIGMLQGDDLAQAQPGEASAPEPGNRTVRHILARCLRRTFPYTSSLIAKKFMPVIPSRELHNAWKKQAAQTLAQFNPEQKARFQALDYQIKEWFAAGELNPAVIYIAVSNPDYFLELEDLASAKTREHIAEMAKQLDRIKKVADQNGARVIVVSVPQRVYISPADFETPIRFGFNLDPKMLSSDAMDQAIKMAADQAGLEFWQVTPQFRSASKTSHLFFPLDGHFNPQGHALFAELLAGPMGKFIK